ncbi:hypothetical protein [Speluncibacter jeojiensis]|nr:hypothetical protein [Rhodococcus sp. D2-41]
MTARQLAAFAAAVGVTAAGIACAVFLTLDALATRLDRNRWPM